MDNKIRIRACVAVVRDGKILLVPHYDTDAGEVQWNLPGGAVEYCEYLKDAATREFKEETGLDVEISDVLEVTEVVLPEPPYHSIAIIFLGINTRGRIKSEKSLRYGEKTPRWFSVSELKTVEIHPQSAIIKAMEKTKTYDDLLPES